MKFRNMWLKYYFSPDDGANGGGNGDGNGSNGGNGDGNGGDDGANGGDAGAKLSQYAQDISRLKKELKARLSEDERKKLEAQEKEQKLAELIARVNKSAIKAAVGEAKNLVKFEESDKSFDDILGFIVADDEEQATERGTALNNLLKKFYEQGKADALKEVGKNLSNGVQTGANKGETNIGAKLAQNARQTIDGKKFDNFIK